MTRTSGGTALPDVKRALLEDLGRLRAPEGYLFAGSPRYHTLFGRDSLISAWQTLEVDPSIARATLRILSRFQGRRVHPPAEEEPGKILHEHRFDAASRMELPHWEFPYYGSVDSTPLFLVVAEAYARRTGDSSLVSELWDAFVNAHRWIVSCGDRAADGYAEYERQNPHGLFHQGWKDGSEDHLSIRPPVALVEVQGYVYAAHMAFASLAGQQGRPDLAEDARRRAASLRVAVNRDFWLPEVNFYALAIDGEKRPRRAATSNPGHLLVMGILPPERARLVATRLFADDLWTPYGIRTHATSEPDFDPYGYHLGSVWPHDNWMIYRGLLAHGFAQGAARVQGALLRAYDELGKIPELYAVEGDDLVDLSAGPVHGTRANPLQAWAAGALLDIVGREPASISP